MNVKIINCLIFFSLMCSNVQTLASNEPEWYNMVNTNSDIFIGNGIGKTQEEAKNSALTELVNSIYVTIESSSSLMESIDRNKSKRISSSELITNSGAISLPNLKWIKLEERSSLYFAKVQVKKIDFIMEYENKIKILLKELSSLKETYKFNLSQYIYFLKRKDEIYQTLRIVLSFIDHSEHFRLFKKSIDNIIFKAANFSHQFCLNLQSSQSSGYEAKIILPKISNILTKNGLLISNDSHCEILHLRTSSRTERINSIRLEHIVVSISIGEPSVFSKNYKLVGQSEGSKKEAIYDAVQKLSINKLL